MGEVVRGRYRKNGEKRTSRFAMRLTATDYAFIMEFAHGKRRTAASYVEEMIDKIRETERTASNGS